MRAKGVNIMTEFEMVQRLSNPSASSQFEKIMAHSAHEFSRWEAEDRAWKKAAQAAADRKRAAEESTIAVKDEMIKQNALLRKQVKALEVANAAAANQAKSDRLWKWIMFIVALAGIITAIAF